MSRLEGFQTCPRCGKNTLPRIQPDSKANAVKCQACGQVIDRAELEAIAERARLKAIEDAKKKAAIQPK
jgi:transcription elongation factor Elf1